jgi:hypothetical protein
MNRDFDNRLDGASKTTMYGNGKSRTGAVERLESVARVIP